MTRRAEASLLLAGCALLYLTGLGDVPFYTRGEPREGNVVRQMVEGGQWLVPERPEGEPARKPPLYYWSAATAWTAFGERPEFAMRLPSACNATAGVLGTWAVAGEVFGAAAALPAAIVLATAFEWTRAAVSARVDMTLAAGTTAVLLGWTMALARGGRGWLVVATLGAVAGTLAKGPVALILPTLTVLVLAARERSLRLVWRLGVPWMLGVAVLVAGAWYAAAFAREGPEYVRIFLHENLLRFVDTEKGRTGHHQPTWYLIVLGVVGFLPWTALLPLGVGAPSDGGDDGRRAARALVATWSVVVLVFFSLASAKRSVYLLPLFPAVAMLVGAGVAGPGDDRAGARWATRLLWVMPPVVALLGVLTAAYAVGVDPSWPLHAHLRPDDLAGAAALADATRGLGPLLGALAFATLVGAGWLLREARAPRWPRVVRVVGALMMLWVVVFDGVLHPRLARGRSLQDFMRRVAMIVPEHEPLHAFYPPDPGLRFYAPRLVRAWPRAGIDRVGYLLLWEDEWRRLRDANGAPLQPLAVSDAIQAGRGHLTLVAPPPGALQRPTAPPAAPPAAHGAPTAGVEPELRTGS